MNSKQRRAIARTPVSRSLIAAATTRVSGGPIDPEGATWPMTVALAGPANTTLELDGEELQAYFGVEALKAAAKTGQFEGADSYENHPTDAEADARPERDTAKKIGRVRGASWDESLGDLGGVKATWKCMDPTYRARLLNAASLGELDFLDFSVYGPVRAERRVIDGKAYAFITEFSKPNVDLVTEGAAGGQFLFQKLAASVRAAKEIPMRLTWTAFKAAKATIAASLVSAASDDALIKQIDELELTFAEGVEADAAKAEFIAAAKAERAAVVKAAEVKPEPEPKTKPVEKPVAAAQEACDACGEMVAAGAKYCPECGASMSAAAEAAETLAKVEEVKAAIDATAVQVAAAAKLITDAGRETVISGKLADFDEVDREHLRPTLRASADVAGMDAAIKAHQAYLAKQAAVGAFPVGMIRGSETPEAGLDQMGKFGLALQGFFRGKDVDKIPRFHNVAEALANFPNFRIAASSNWRSGVVNFEDMRAAWSGLGGYFKNGNVKRGGAVVPLVKASITSVTFGEVFADRLHKEAMMEWTSPDSLDEFLSLASRTIEVNDFKAHRITVVGNYSNAVEVTEGATYPTGGTPTDAEETVTLKKYGRIEDITLEAFMDPDNNQIAMIPRRLASSIRRAVRQIIINKITTDNPTLNQDSVALYHSTHANTGTAQLTVSSANAVRTAMIKQTERDSGERLGLLTEPTAVLVPGDLIDRAETVFSPSAAIIASVAVLGTDQALDPNAAWRQRVKRIVVPHWTDVDNHFYVADPKKIETFVVAFLRGVRDVEIFTQDSEESPSMFDADTRKIKGRFFCGVAPLTYQAFYRQVAS